MMEFDDEDSFEPLAPSNVIPFPGMRPNRKLSEAWQAKVSSSNEKNRTTYQFPSPTEVVGEVIKQRGMPRMAWPAAWPNIARRMVTVPGDMVGVVGSQGGGKTSFGIQVGIANTAEGIPAGWAPFELDRAQIVTRIAANMHNVHAMAVREGWSQERLNHAMAAIADLWHFVDSPPGVERKLAAMRAIVVMALEIYRRPPVLIVDHVGKLASGARDPRIGTMEALEALRELTVEMQCYTIALSQGSRGNQATLTGKVSPESAADALGVAAESKSFEDDCANVIALALYKQDDAPALDARGLIGKARHTGEEGQVGMRFLKAGGVWQELDYLPATPGEVTEEVARAKKDKNRSGIPPELPQARADLNAARAGDANAARRSVLFQALVRHGALGMDPAAMRQIRGVGRGPSFHAAIQELERAGSAERVGNRWRAILRPE